jgi:hypothetical protein
LSQFASHIIVEGPSQLFISIMLQSAFLGEMRAWLCLQPCVCTFLNIVLHFISGCSHKVAGNGFQLVHFPERFMVLWDKLVKRITTNSTNVKMEARDPPDLPPPHQQPLPEP